MRGRLVKNGVFEEYDFGDILPADATAKIRDIEMGMKARDKDIMECYELRNSLESLLYRSR